MRDLGLTSRGELSGEKRHPRHMARSGQEATDEGARSYCRLSLCSQRMTYRCGMIRDLLEFSSARQECSLSKSVLVFDELAQSLINKVVINKLYILRNSSIVLSLGICLAC